MDELINFVHTFPFYFNTSQYFAANATEYWKLLKQMEAWKRNGLRK